MFRILICPEEFHNEEEGRDRLQTWGNSGLQLVLHKKGCEDALLSGLTAPQDALWIVTEESQWQLAVDRDIAVLPYAPGDTYAFPKAEYIITGLWEVERSYLEQVYCRCHNIPWTVIRQPDFFLREFAMSDLDALFALYDDPTLYPYVEPLFSREEEIIYEEKYIKNMYGLLGFGMWLVCDPETGEVIGRAGLEVKEDRTYERPKIADDDAPQGASYLEMGWLIRRDRRGKGLAEKVCRAILGYAASELSYPEVTCLIHDDNVPSVGLAQKLGFRLVGPAERGMSCYKYKLGG